MTAFKIAIPVELTGTRAARTLHDIADYQDVRATRGSAKPKHGAFRPSRVDALLASARRRASAAVVTVKAQLKQGQREFSFEYRRFETSKPAPSGSYVVHPQSEEADPDFMERVLLDTACNMISRGYIRDDNTLRATVLVVSASGWSSSLRVSGDVATVQMDELTTISHEVEQ